MKSFPEVLDFLYSRLPMFQRSGPAAYRPNLDNTIALLRSLGDPQHGFRSIHVAGTNGKGSVSHFLAAIFQSAGYKTGLYTSPHLKDFRERIRINGEMISEQAVVDFVSSTSALALKIEPSFFEMTVAMAFDHFRNEAVDVAVIETGLGGRLDSTNVIEPDISIITNIGLDHTNLLGGSHQLIAAEKAGIIKNKVPVVIGVHHLETAPVFLSKARETNSILHFADQRVKVKRLHENSNPGSMQVSVSSEKYKEEEFTIGLNGNYQLENIATIFTSLSVLEQSWKLAPAAVREGLEKVVELTGLRGRWEKLQDSPLVICDTGHNEDGIKQVTHQLQSLVAKKIHFVLGLVSDKDPKPVLSLLPQNAIYYFCQAQIPRALSVDELVQHAKGIPLEGTPYPSVQAAYKAALSAADPEHDVVFVGGSTFVVAEVL